MYGTAIVAPFKRIFIPTAECNIEILSFELYGFQGHVPWPIEQGALKV